MSFDLISAFAKEAKNSKFDICGMIDREQRIYSLGSDSKIIGRIFELLSHPILKKIADENGLILKIPESQTAYPDFVMMENELSKEKIAIDIKTTYVKTTGMQFTLGSYGSYMRNNKKNIMYQYTDYKKHYVIGFVYERNKGTQQGLFYPISEIDDVQVPYGNVKYFIQEKYKIAGDRPGSGDTENIGSIKTKKLEDFTKGKGPFTVLGHVVYDLYWKYYPKYRSKEKPYTNLFEFCSWLPKQNKPELLYEYDFDKVLAKVKRFENKNFGMNDEKV